MVIQGISFQRRNFRRPNQLAQLIKRREIVISGLNIKSLPIPERERLGRELIRLNQISEWSEEIINRTVDNLRKKAADWSKYQTKREWLQIWLENASKSQIIQFLELAKKNCQLSDDRTLFMFTIQERIKNLQKEVNTVASKVREEAGFTNMSSALSIKINKARVETDKAIRAETIDSTDEIEIRKIIEKHLGDSTYPVDLVIKEWRQEEEIRKEIDQCVTQQYAYDKDENRIHKLDIIYNELASLLGLNWRAGEDDNNIRHGEFYLGEDLSKLFIVGRQTIRGTDRQLTEQELEVARNRYKAKTNY